VLPFSVAALDDRFAVARRRSIFGAGIRPGGRPVFLLAKRKKAKKALQLNTMVIYTSALTTAVTHSPARRAQTAALAALVPIHRR
jgi:hypothetical protein